MRKAIPVALIALALTVIFGGTASADTKTVYDTFQKKGGYSLSDYNAKWSKGPAASTASVTWECTGRHPFVCGRHLLYRRCSIPNVL